MAHYRDEYLINEVIQRLKNLRESRFLSQEQVFNDTGIHVGRIESRKLNITISTLKCLCDYYEVTLGDFFADSPSAGK